MITEKKIPKYLRDNYPSIGTIFNTEKIHAVNINSINYLIEAEKGKFILKNFFCDVNRVKKISTILNACQNYTDSIPKIISTKSGKLLESKYKCYLIQFMNGSSFVHSKLNKLNNMTCFEPGGAFYAFPNVSKSGLSGQKFSDIALEDKGVALVPGTSFGDSAKDFVRISYANSMENLEKAIYRLSSV